MEYLETLKFFTSKELLRFVNSNGVKVVSITQDDLSFTLFFKKILK
jgi:hypothetical protein